MTYGYIRVSTDAQNTENQKMEIQKFCAQNGIDIDLWVEDIISGTKDPSFRNWAKLSWKTSGMTTSSSVPNFHAWAGVS